ncbi:MAG: hypothetical protein EPO21_07755 [Chloroflexota bacterium]|nr:MAG: hypothetical protein EPO21_07755 [Chloroflexota bacterium]
MIRSSVRKGVDKRVKKLLIIAAATIVLSLAAVAIVFADAGPHGTGGNGYGITTGACAGCHRAHTAVGEFLITQPNIYELCVSCHGSGATGSTLNVEDGNQLGARLNGGGFDNINGALVTSKHSVKDSGTIIDDSAVQIAWGGTVDGKGIDVATTRFGFECTSCHNPHGSTNYRILQDANPGHKMPKSFTDLLTFQPAPNNDKEVVTPEGEALPWRNQQVLSMPGGTVISQDGQSREYFGDTNANVYGGHTYTQTSFKQTLYTQGINDFCASCHKTYLTRHTSAETRSDSTDPYEDTGDRDYQRYDGMQKYVYPNQDTSSALTNRFEYRHTVSRHFKIASASDVSNAIRPEERDHAIYDNYPWRDGYAVPLRFAIDGTTTTPITKKYGFTCLTCHFAHGTTATLDSPYVNDPATPFLASKSALLYYPERGVCGACHQQGK